MLMVKEVFATLQGEGSRAGTPAVFVRFVGCNLWSGLPAGRERGAGECAAWCDTDFASGERWSPEALADHVLQVALDAGHALPYVVLTGGEPTLQLGRPDGLRLLQLLDGGDAELAIETNGTNALGDVAEYISHITVSPKPLRGAGGSLQHLQQRKGTDLKVVCPTPFDPEELHALRVSGFEFGYAQPLDVADRGASSLPAAMALAARLGWRVSLQTHKFAGLP